VVNKVNQERVWPGTRVSARRGSVRMIRRDSSDETTSDEESDTEEEQEEEVLEERDMSPCNTLDVPLTLLVNTSRQMQCCRDSIYTFLHRRKNNMFCSSGRR